VNIFASILTSIAVCALISPVADGQVCSNANPWNGSKGVVVAELAAKSNDDDDDSGAKGPHSSAAKKKSLSDDSGEKSSASKTAAAKKKKKEPDEDDNGAGSGSGSAKKSGASDSDLPSRDKKKAHDDGDEVPSQAKSKSPDEKPSRDAAQDAAADSSKHAPSATVEPAAIVEFAGQPERIQRLITAALDLTKLNLTYTYGSAEPSKGGMDCSGTIYYLLHSQGFQDVPRDSSGQYVWARKQGRFFAVVSTRPDSFEFKDLQPGDLMFWSGTYQVERDIPISHVMLYLGTEKRTGKRIMFGSSDGRSYDGVQRWGVSVFDFKMPKNDPNNSEKRRVDFVGYARIPGLRESVDPSQAIAATSEEKSSPSRNSTVKDADAKDADESTPPPKKKSAVKKTTPRKRVENSDSQ